jgi:hypothetical protein
MHSGKEYVIMYWYSPKFFGNIRDQHQGVSKNADKIYNKTLTLSMSIPLCSVNVFSWLIFSQHNKYN